jgi:hypothetical protein
MQKLSQPLVLNRTQFKMTKPNAQEAMATHDPSSRKPKYCGLEDAKGLKN